MAQSVCAVIKRCPKDKSMAQMPRHWLFPNGAPMAHDGADGELPQPTCLARKDSTHGGTQDFSVAEPGRNPKTPPKALSPSLSRLRASFVGFHCIQQRCCVFMARWLATTVVTAINRQKTVIFHQPRYDRCNIRCDKGAGMPLERHQRRPEGLSRPGPVGRHPEASMLPPEASPGKGRGVREWFPVRPEVAA